MKILFGVLFFGGYILLVGYCIRAIIFETDKPNRKAPRLTFADSDISDTLDELLKRPEVLSMSAKKGEAYHIKITTADNKPGHEYTGYGPAVIVAVPEDSECDQ